MDEKISCLPDRPSRAKTKQLRLGNVLIGGSAPIVVQSMTNTDTRNIEATLAQIEALVQAGCELVRLAVLDNEAVIALASIIKNVSVPIIADIHFDYRLAIACLDNGVHGLRINPGNIGSIQNVHKLIDAAKANNAVIRIGVNSGSIQKDLLQKYKGICPQVMVESALEYIHIFEQRNFYNLKISLKSSSVMDSIAAYRMLAKKCDYALHIGITEAGTMVRGSIKSAVGLGILLYEGIGDTLRVSLTADPVQEIFVAYEILRALGLRHYGPEIISCPTCGRTEIDLISMTQEVEKRLAGEKAAIKVAVMGCVVNGPGEAREADLGLAGGRDKGIIFRKGQIVRTVRGQEALLAAFMEELNCLLKEKG